MSVKRRYESRDEISQKSEHYRKELKQIKLIFGIVCGVFALFAIIAFIKPEADIVRSRCFEVVDDSGNVVMRMESKNGSGIISLLNTKSDSHIVLSARRTDSEILLVGPSNDSQIIIRNGLLGGMLELQDSKAKPIIALCALLKNIRFFDKHGEVKKEIGIDDFSIEQKNSSEAKSPK